MFLGKKRREEEDRAAIIQRDLVIAYKQAFGSEQGRAVLLDMMNKFHVLNTHRGDAFLEGQRTVVLHILEQCHVSLEAFDSMLKGEEYVVQD